MPICISWIMGWSFRVSKQWIVQAQLLPEWLAGIGIMRARRKLDQESHPLQAPSRCREMPSRSSRELIKKVWEVDPLLSPISSRDAQCVADQRRADHQMLSSHHRAVAWWSHAGLWRRALIEDSECDQPRSRICNTRDLKNFKVVTDIAWNYRAISSDANTTKSSGTSGNCSAASAKVANERAFRHVFAVRHRRVTFNVRKRCFIVDLPGTCLRH